VTVEDGDGGHQPRGDGQRRPPGRRHRETERQRRQCDPGFHARQRDAEQAEEPTERHDQREGYRQEPQRRCAELRAPQADRDHGEHVVEPGDRVRESGQEAGGLSLLNVRERRHRGQRRHPGEEESPRIPWHLHHHRTAASITSSRCNVQ
jgi:hypothetical protein